MYGTTLTQLVAVVQKEVRQTLRDRRMLGVLFIAPLIQLTILGKAVDFSIDHVPTVLVDQDRTSISRGYLHRLLADGTLLHAGETDEQEAQARIEDGRASAAVIIPPGFGRALDAGQPVAIQVILDGSNPNRSGAAGTAASRFFANASAELLSARTGRSVGGIDLEARVFYNPRMETAVYMVPGTAAMLLLIATTVIAAMGLAREKELGTFEQVMVTPIAPWVLILGKVLPFIVVGLINVLGALTVGAWVFDVPIRGSLTFLVAATFAYMLSTLGVGLLISTVSNSQQQAFIGAFMFMLPAMLLSGTVTPIAAMPGWMQPITRLNPMRYFIEILRADLLRGAGWIDLWPQLVSLLVIGTTLLTFSALKFRKTLG